MKTVLAAIARRKRAFARLPLFDFLSDETLAPEERLSFYPAMAHWIMSFGDLNKYVLRDEPSADEHQRVVNDYTHEDDFHYNLYLEDFRKLGCERLCEGADWLRFLWGRETRSNRVLSYRLAALILGATGAQRLAIIEAMEEAGHVFFDHTVRIADEFERRTGVELRYLGRFHQNLEAEHSARGDEELLTRVELDEPARRRAVEMVEEVFDLFEDWAAEVHAYAQAQLRPEPARLAA